jgi:hypothetical protein
MSALQGAIRVRVRLFDNRLAARRLRGLDTQLLLCCQTPNETSRPPAGKQIATKRQANFLGTSHQNTSQTVILMIFFGIYGLGPGVAGVQESGVQESGVQESGVQEFRSQEFRSSGVRSSGVRSQEFRREADCRILRGESNSLQRGTAKSDHRGFLFCNS